MELPPEVEPLSEPLSEVVLPDCVEVVLPDCEPLPEVSVTAPLSATEQTGTSAVFEAHVWLTTIFSPQTTGGSAMLPLLTLDQPSAPEVTSSSTAKHPPPGAHTPRPFVVSMATFRLASVVVSWHPPSMSVTGTTCDVPPKH